MSRDNMDKHLNEGPLDPAEGMRPEERLGQYGPEIDGEPSDAGLLDALSERDDDLLRQLSLSMDDRLGPDEESRLKALIGNDDDAANIESDLIRARGMLHEVAAPPIPHGLLERTLSRVSEASKGAENTKDLEGSQDPGRILFLARGLALAAAILLVGSMFAYSNHNGQVKAAPPTQTVEDQLDGGLLDFLKARFLGRSESSESSETPSEDSE